ncbi:hypothetical protein [Psychrobacter sp. M13]|uniref:hypothetical protein n=1 Tax=Psychrobacter sp. M13 TaxID=3067275 RepID=UPI00273C86BB|nr:hypothetical protein [Psychrobacter sp. M13]WLP93412.1 hypothetical protein Q9G97_07290 [Psychrobacter sp. M13]
MKKLALLAIAGLVSVSASAISFDEVYEDNRSTVYVSEKSRSGDKVEALVTNIYKRNMTFSLLSIEYNRIIESVEFICSTPRQSKSLLMITYLDGKEVDRSDLSMFASYEDVDRSASETAVADFLCSR